MHNQARETTTRVCKECGSEDPSVFAGLCQSCLMKKGVASTKPHGEAVIVSTVTEQPVPEASSKRRPETDTLVQRMRARGWGSE